MQFTTVYVALLGLFALTSAAPHPQPESPTVLRDLADLASRGLTWIPKRNHKSKNNVDIVDTTFEQITVVEQGNEIQLTTLVEQTLVKTSQKRKAKDNIRKNHYSAKNQNVNTVITVVTEIIDARSDGQTTRIMTHQVIADNGASESVNVQVVEIKQITIAALQLQGSTATSNAASAVSASAGVSLATIAPNAPFLASNATIMLPPGHAAPNASTVDSDPAAIVEEEQTSLFVSEVVSS